MQNSRLKGCRKGGIEVEMVKFSDVRHLPKLIRHVAYYRRVVESGTKRGCCSRSRSRFNGTAGNESGRRAGKPFVVKIVGDYAWEQGQQRFGITQTLDDFVQTTHVPFFGATASPYPNPCCTRAVRVIVPSEYLKDIVIQWGIPEKKLQSSITAFSFRLIYQRLKKKGEFLIVSADCPVPWKGFEAIKRLKTNVLTGTFLLRQVFHANKLLDGRRR